MRETLITTNNNNNYSLIKNSTNHKTSLTNILNCNDLCVSIELCPNRNINTDFLADIPHSFCSVTWRNPSKKELENIENITAILLAKKLQYFGYNVLLHLAGRNLKRYHILKILQTVKDAGIRNILALQGDPSQIEEKDDNKCDFPYAADLVKFIRNYYGNTFIIAVAAYPEKHPNSKTLEIDLDHLKHKVSCGANFIITQACYSSSIFSNFIKRCRSLDIDIPIIPGIFIIKSYKTMMAMSNFCGIPIPENIFRIVERNKENDIAIREFGIYQSCELMKTFLSNRELYAGIHVFSLNNLELLKEVVIRVGLIVQIEKPFQIFEFKWCNKSINSKYNE